MFNVKLLRDQKRVAVQYLLTVNEHAEFLTPIGCGPLASRTNPHQQYECALVCGLHTVCSGIDPRDHRLGSRCVGFVEI